MDVLRHKLALPSLVPWPGTSHAVPLYPLSDAVVAWAEADARALWASRGAPARDSLFRLEVWVQTLARAARRPAEALRDAYPQEVAILYRAWLGVQGLADREADYMREWLRKRVNDDLAVHHDGAAAYAAEEGPSAFYGRSSTGLTRGQLLYYWGVREAYAEWFGAGATKKPTRSWLNAA